MRRRLAELPGAESRLNPLIEQGVYTADLGVCTDFLCFLRGGDGALTIRGPV